MDIEQTQWTTFGGWVPCYPGRLKNTAQLVILFGSPSVCKNTLLFEELRSLYPAAHLFGCTTAGEIYGTQVADDSLVVTAIHFEHGWVKGGKMAIGNMHESFDVGRQLAAQFGREDLVHLFVLSEGININGSELVKGLTSVLGPDIAVTGGLAGDANRFQETYVCWDSGPQRNQVAALGLYGKTLKVGYGSFGGWDSFGPERLITHSQGNILYEFDGRSALDLYKLYLGEHAQGLPATGLLFPLLLRMEGNEKGIVRTILAVNEDEKSLTFAGDVPEGAYARLMKANFDRLIDGAVEAAKRSCGTPDLVCPDLAILISCVGRKLILGQRIEEEIEGVRYILGDKAIFTGFYSYGEISPFSQGEKSELHNQTMTITTISEDQP